jgi:hypothetical protein
VERGRILKTLPLKLLRKQILSHTVSEWTGWSGGSALGMVCEDARFKSRRGHTDFPEDFCGIHQSRQAKDGIVSFSTSFTIQHPSFIRRYIVSKASLNSKTKRKFTAASGPRPDPIECVKITQWPCNNTKRSVIRDYMLAIMSTNIFDSYHFYVTLNLHHYVTCPVQGLIPCDAILLDKSIVAQSVSKLPAF